MVAFANSHGGTLLLGVNGDGNVTGVSLSQVRDIEEWVVNIATNHCQPSIEPRLSTVDLLDEDDIRKTVFIVERFPEDYMCMLQVVGAIMCGWVLQNRSY